MSQLTKVRYDKRTTGMDPKEEMYWLHFLSKQKSDPVVGNYIKSQLQVNPTFRRDILQQPVCERCECFAFYSHDGVMCSSCGHLTPHGKTHKVKIHLAGGHYR